MVRITLLFIIFASSTPVLSQVVSLTGKVSNAQGKPIAGAHVTLVKQRYTVDTDSIGFFRIAPDVSNKIQVAQEKNVDQIEIRNSIIFLNLMAPSPVRFEQFNFYGKLIKRIDFNIIQSGKYSVENMDFSNASTMSALRISTNSAMKTFKWLSIGNKPLISCDISATSIKKEVSSVVTMPFDSLKISAAGYYSKTIPVFLHLNSPIAVTLYAMMFGEFKIQLVPAEPDMGDPAYTRVFGIIYDGPIPPAVIFEKVEESGPCKLFKAISPFCVNCNLGGKCVADDSCQREPSPVNVGNVTVSGLKLNGVQTPFTIIPPKSNFYQLVGKQPDYPPFSEGDSIFLDAEGTTAYPPFIIKSRGIAPLVVSNEMIMFEDGKSVTLRWEKPAVAGVSTMNIRINISYHGGTKGEIIVDCEDNGEVTVPASMIDRLKSWGIAGFPVAQFTRQSIISTDSRSPGLIIQSTKSKLITIPGLVDCNQNEDCTSGKCIDRMCR